MPQTLTCHYLYALLCVCGGLNNKDVTKEEVQKLKHGVYRLYWSARTYSLASVGSLHDGSRWFACANWTSETEEGVTGSGDDWNSVVKAVLIESR